MDRSGEKQGRPLWWLRWILAILFLGASWGLIQGAYCADAIVQSFWLSLCALCLLIVAALLLLPEAITIATAPFNAMADSLFFPRGKAPPPGLDHYYRLIDSFRDQERWDDLADICEEILLTYPGELIPYQELFELYAGSPEDAKYLARLRRKARKHLSEDDFHALETGEEVAQPDSEPQD